MKQLILSIVLAFGFIAYASASSTGGFKIPDVDVSYVVQTNDFNSVVNFEATVIESDFQVQSLFSEKILNQEVFCKPFKTDKETRSWCSYSRLNYNYKTKDYQSQHKNCLVYFDDHPINS